MTRSTSKPAPPSTITTTQPRRLLLWRVLGFIVAVSLFYRLNAVTLRAMQQPFHPQGGQAVPRPGGKVNIGRSATYNSCRMSDTLRRVQATSPTGASTAANTVLRTFRPSTRLVSSWDHGAHQQALICTHRHPVLFRKREARCRRLITLDRHESGTDICNLDGRGVSDRQMGRRRGDLKWIMDCTL